ncbi:(4Fe-4S)-binding protein [Bradyrhizobium sp. 6(2017)]|uniref:(4Fe-4S)-binding protein n=1 Tax=Bradyrhizobium sp. 6(2017) TaxID=1197460 RepID=UPI001FEDDD2E|nr:(4Fe-4S)-binding protein [Bradyrhizobium sp. 6(2017)]
MTEDSSAHRLNDQQQVRNRITVRRNGPYEPEPGIPIVDHLGVPVTAEAAVLLCRCGQSQTKPFCDDSHVARGFTDARDPRRVPDKLDVYAGQQAYVFDNRGTCAHSGFCTDRLSSVFHLGEEPFIAPSGARLDDLINAVRRCPSGALGIGIGPVRDATCPTSAGRRRSKCRRTAPIASPAMSNWSMRTARRSHRTPARRRSMSACAAAARR